MPNPLTVRFLSDVKKLELKFPVAEISKKTGYSKATVSELLSGKKEPTNNFLAKFVAAFLPDQVTEFEQKEKRIHVLEEEQARYTSESKINSLELMKMAFEIASAEKDKRIDNLMEQVIELKKEIQAVKAEREMYKRQVMEEKLNKSKRRSA